jgi:Concanavalin A-like lectin/glucanases superfamily
MNGNGCTGGSNCLIVHADIGGSSICIGCGGGANRLTEFKIHHVALTYEGSTLRLFIDGVLAGSTAASGTWTIPPYESFELADQSPSIYLGSGTTTNVTPAFYDSIRISNTARYTSNFTPPTAKFTADASTMFLENFPTNAPTGTIEGYSGINGGTNVFIPIETSNGAAALNPLYIGNMQLSDNGIYANWVLNSTIENIQVQGAGRTCLNLHDNDFQDTVRRFFCSVVPAAKTNVGFLFLNQSNNNIYDHLQCDGQYSCVGQVSGSGHYIMPDFTDRTFAVAPLYFVQAQALLDSPELDVEDTATNQIAAVYSNGAYAPIVINGGQLLSGASGNAYLAISGGAPFIVNGSQFTGGSPAELLNVIANPLSPVVVRDVIQPSGIAATNAGKSWWLTESLGGQDPGVKFADLPSSVTNGARRYCADCDPPANPPVACTSTGARTGAWVNGLNNTWICVP